MQFGDVKKASRFNRLRTRILLDRRARALPLLLPVENQRLVRLQLVLGFGD